MAAKKPLAGGAQLGRGELPVAALLTEAKAFARGQLAGKIRVVAPQKLAEFP